MGQRRTPHSGREGFQEGRIYGGRGRSGYGNINLSLATLTHYSNTFKAVIAQNFSPNYLKINPNGTVPSLTSAALDKPLVDSTEILDYLDKLGSGPSLVPDNKKRRDLMDVLISLVHSDALSTNLVLLQARNKDEMDMKKSSLWKDFVSNRQRKLDGYASALPNHPFYGPKSKENGVLYELYTTGIGDHHEEFFRKTSDMYQDFAAGLNRLDSLIVLPYATGQTVTAADIHIIPWLAHALWGAGGSAIDDFEPLERLIQKTVPDFEFGGNIRNWWSNISARDSFKQVFPHLH
jgi:glutathione S-transferase